MGIFSWARPKNESKRFREIKKSDKVVSISPGRVSEPEQGTTWGLLKEQQELVTPSFREDIVPLIRDLYKINPDVGIALQDMFKLANTDHFIKFPYNTEKEADEMRKFLKDSRDQWGLFNSGFYGLVNKMLVQCLVGGAISVEAVPNRDLTNLSTVIFINPENVRFKRRQDGVYHPYQKTTRTLRPDGLVKLNPSTYFYAPIFNDTDEPYGIPSFMPSLDSIDGQYVMRNNFKHIMEQMGLLGFLEVKMAKPDKRGSESDQAYIARLNNNLRQLKRNVMEGMSDGVVTGYIDDHEFDLKSTTKNLTNVDKLWEMNQQSIANGLGVSGNIIGISNANTEGGAGILLSKLISQLRNVQYVTQNVIVKIYELALLLGGYNNKGCIVEFGASTVSDDLKVQQAQEIKIRNLKELYLQGIIGQDDYAWGMGYAKPREKEPRIPIELMAGKTKQEDKEKREDDKDKSDRKGRDKNKPNPKRADQNPKER